MGEEAARLLFRLIKEEEEDFLTSRSAQHIQIHCKLVVHK
jgi:hypothetical protein